MKDFFTLCQESDSLDRTTSFKGQKIDDKNIKGNFIIFVNKNEAYSFNVNDIMDEITDADGITTIKIRTGATGIKFVPFIIGDKTLSFADTLENSKPPKHILGKGEPRMATVKDQQILIASAPTNGTLAAVAASWTNSCTLGDMEQNNCAHFLSDAFIKAGFNDLLRSNNPPQINVRCDFNDGRNSLARPIRAKELRDWFEHKAEHMSRVRPTKKGFWAVFQWDGAQYPGGHVLLFDSDKNLCYGTGVYWNWSDQFFYQW